MNNESKNLLEFLENEDNKFYFPNNSLSTELVKAIEFELDQDLKALNHQISEKELKEIPFEQIIQENDSDESVHKENLLGFQRRLSKEIYFYLDFLVRNQPQGTTDLLFNSVFSYEMGKNLGLKKTHYAIINLTQSFINWIKEKGSFTAGWGIIRWDNQKQIILHSFQERVMEASGKVGKDKTVIFNVS